MENLGGGRILWQETQAQQKQQLLEQLPATQTQKLHQTVQKLAQLRLVLKDQPKVQLRLLAQKPVLVVLKPQQAALQTKPMQNQNRQKQQLAKHVEKNPEQPANRFFLKNLFKAKGNLCFFYHKKTLAQ